MTAALLAAAAVWVLILPPPRLGDAASRGGPIRMLPLVIVVMTAAVVGGAPVPSALVLVLAATGWAAQRLWSRQAAARAASQTRQRVLESCELLASELAAGQPPSSALGLASEEWSVLGPVAQSAHYGGDVPSAFRRAAGAPGASDLRWVAAAWQVSHRTGHGLADSLGRVAASLRDGLSTERVVRGELASARATARLVAGLPLVALVIGSGSGGNPVGFLLTTLPGVVCLAGGLALVMAGLGWIERIAAGVDR